MEERKKAALGDPFSTFIKILNCIGCGLTMFLMVAIMADVIGRSVFNKPITGVPELVVALITIIAFLQLTYVQLMDMHLTVSIFFEKLSIKIQHGIKAFTQILGIFTFSLMAYSAYGNLIYSIVQKESEGEGALVLPMWPVRGTIFICSIFVVMIMVRQIFWLLTGRNVLGTVDEVIDNGC